MKVVITGGCGYVGSKIVKKLVKSNHEIIIFDRASAALNIFKNKNIEFLDIDITNYEKLKLLRIKNIDAVMHLAAQSSGPRSIEIPHVDIDINIIGTLNMIKWSSLNQVKKIIFASSFVVYGDQLSNEKVSEESITNPKSIYALSKFYSEKLFDIYASHLGIKWNILRMFNIYGPGQDLSRADQGMVSIFMNLVMKNDYVEVKGSLDRFRDFVYIDDVVNAWELCLLDNDNNNQIYNLGSGEKTTVKFLIDTLSKIFNKENIIIRESEGTPGDILGCYSDISKISNKLGYKPQFNIENGLLAMSEWAKSVKK